MGFRNLIGLGARHTDHDYANRRSKAKRIVTLISRFIPIQHLRVLDFGTGTGLVALEMQRILGETCSVAASDVEYRMMDKGIPYLPSIDNRLAVEDGVFDLVVSNHVIEHVGDESDQLSYLRECRRLISTDGLLYIACPNRWTIFEPHYGSPFVSWSPEQYRDKYLNWLSKMGLVRNKLGPELDGSLHYRMRPLSRRQITDLMKRSGFNCKEVTFDSIKLVLTLEFGWAKLPAIIGALFINIVFRPVVPTVSFVATPGSEH